MKRWFSLLMLAGALLGLLGQEAAFAHVVPVVQADHEATASQMSPDCAEMMGLAQQLQQQPGKPCEGMTPDCIAKMGCGVPLALIPPLTFNATLQFRAAAPPQVPVATLIGRETGPEPEPPARLG